MNKHIQLHVSQPGPRSVSYSKLGANDKLCKLCGVIYVAQALWCELRAMSFCVHSVSCAVMAKESKRCRVLDVV
eukprot:8992214-Pyramimonas_sp.AAC.1